MIKHSTKSINIEGIEDVQEVFHNLSYDELYAHETNQSLEGYEKGYVSSLGAVAVAGLWLFGGAHG